MWIWMGIALAAPIPCHTMVSWSEWQHRPIQYTHITKDPLEHLDAFDTPIERIEFSEHFALHWGENYDGLDRVTDVLVLLEDTWDMQIDTWGMEAPVGGSYFNVYLGGTGSNMPPDLGVAGYYDLDDNGYPMVVLGSYVTDSWSIGQTTVPHEFFHAVQHRSGQFTQFQDRWYWEASATWVEQEVLAAHPSHADFLFGYALRPYLPLAYFELFSGGNIEEYHPYGAFIFLQYLTDFHVENDSVVLSWIEEGVAESVRPLDWWNAHISNVQLNLGELLSDMSAHNVHWEYPNQLIYQTKVDAYVGEDPSLDQRWAGELTLDSGSHTVPPRLRPGAYGYNYWAFDFDVASEDDSSAEIYFDGTTVGDHFNAVIWRLQLVRQIDGETAYRSLGTTNGDGLWEVSRLELKDATLVVLADSIEAHIDETFTYTVGLRTVEESEKRMGCATQSQFFLMGQGLLIWLVPVLVRRKMQPDLESSRAQ